MVEIPSTHSDTKSTHILSMENSIKNCRALIFFSQLQIERIVLYQDRKKNLLRSKTHKKNQPKKKEKNLPFCNKIELKKKINNSYRFEPHHHFSIYTRNLYIWRFQQWNTSQTNTPNQQQTHQQEPAKPANTATFHQDETMLYEIMKQTKTTKTKNEAKLKVKMKMKNNSAFESRA
jgi:hypothetical protein